MLSFKLLSKQWDSHHVQQRMQAVNPLCKWIPSVMCYGADSMKDFLFEDGAERFILKKAVEMSAPFYDLVFVAYDGDDIFPRKLWDMDGPFLKALNVLLHPDHGTVVVNLHADTGSVTKSTSPLFDPLLPMGRHAYEVCRAYKQVLLEDGNTASPGLSFTACAHWVQNLSLVVCKSVKAATVTNNRTRVLNSLL